MIFSKKEHLSILCIDNNTEEVDFDTLANLLMEKPANMVYCEKAGKLYGIISMGDIHRAWEEKKTTVKINTEFTYLQDFEYMRARKIFLENEKINALPIVDKNHKLVGDYSRWDDAFSGYEFDFLMGNRYADMAWRKYRTVAIVMPSIQLPRKLKLVEKWNSFFETIGIEVEIIQKRDIIEIFDKKDIILFVDEDELRGVGTLYKDLLGKDFKWERAKTLKGIGEAVGEDIEEIVREDAAEAIGKAILEDIINRGVHVITLGIKENENDYWKNINYEINKKFKEIGKKRETKLYEEFWEDFYEDIYSHDYAVEVSTHPYPVYIDNGIPKLKDFESKYYNVRGGERLTVNQPAEYNNTIYFFGPCFIVGWGVEDALTVESQLQEMLNIKKFSSRVVNYGCWSNMAQMLLKICSTRFKKGDIVLMYDQERNFAGIPSINLAGCVERENVPVRWFCDKLIHANHKVFKLWAEEIYEQVCKYLPADKIEGEIDKTEEKYSFLMPAYIERYFADYKFQDVIGSIVMNCNPFTRGHKYLIEEASKNVNHLIIFVVEEDKSLFSFRERFAMVVEGVKDIENVTVVPSGNFILSKQTFPEYFVKVENADTVRNAEFDINLFAEGIASKLGIKIRFVGEEKNDAVTREYNQAMKKILPLHGIKLVEIPRKVIDGKTDPISATIVRKNLELGDWSKVCDLVPQSTIDVLNIL